MKKLGMKWIIPSVVLAIAALIGFQVHWLIGEARLQATEEHRRINEAVNEAGLTLEKIETSRFLGNSLDTILVFDSITQSEDSIKKNEIVFTDGKFTSTKELIIFNDTVVSSPPSPPFPPMSPLPSLQPLGSDTTITLITQRSEQIKSAFRNVMLEYVYQSHKKHDPIPLKQIDSVIQACLLRKEIEHPYSFEVADHGKESIDSLIIENTKPRWRFTTPLFQGSSSHSNLVVWVNANETSPIERILPQLIFSFLITSGMLVLFLLIYREAVKQKKIGDVRRDFINNMTHEFKTPLATISLAADTIMNEKIIGDQERVRYYATQIKTENQKLNIQVEKVLELSMNEKQGLVLKKELIDISTIISSAINTIRIQVEANGGSISFDAKSNSRIISVDPFHLERALLNLLDNAFKYGGKPPVIKITIENIRGGTGILVIDNGVGIPVNEQEGIFNPFHRIGTGDLHNVKGFGLGLSYARSIAEAHGGTLHVSESGATGTTFTLTLKHD
jgi:two-component system, OmpR family, phosphate regulon sensor histidine kinase PhoR